MTEMQNFFLGNGDLFNMDTNAKLRFLLAGGIGAYFFSRMIKATLPERDPGIQAGSRFFSVFIGSFFGIVYGTMAAVSPISFYVTLPAWYVALRPENNEN